MSGAEKVRLEVNGGAATLSICRPEAKNALSREIVDQMDALLDQVAADPAIKVLVVKSKRFLDLILPSLSEGDRKAADQELARVLDAIGNPGVFGVGAKPADAAAFTDAEKALMAVLAPL